MEAFYPPIAGFRERTPPFLLAVAPPVCLTEREPKSQMIASLATDDLKPLHSGVEGDPNPSHFIATGWRLRAPIVPKAKTL